jgi:hypothetical protein
MVQGHMETNLLATAKALSDQDLLARLDILATKEREASVELVAHLAALDSRPAVYAAQGCGSLFRYCTNVLRLSEDAACNRIEAARACRRFPLVLDLLASGSLTLTPVRLLARHLTRENHREVLSRAGDRSRREIEALVAELAPRPDVPGSVRALPAPKVQASSPATAPAGSTGLMTGTPQAPAASTPILAATPPPAAPTSRPIVQATAPERYRVQFTIGRETHDKLRRLQALLRREVPDGDPSVLFGRALTLLLEKTEKRKLGAAARPRSRPAIRPGTDGPARKGVSPARPGSRDIPREVKREVWGRDAGQCAFVAGSGRRCSETTFLEFHHVLAYARQGPATVENISLRCFRHNQYEAELIFGPRQTAADEDVRQAPALVSEASGAGHADGDAPGAPRAPA